MNDGVLTLKGGSKLYYPDGFETDGTTPKFSTFIVPADTIVSQVGTNNDALICYRMDTNKCYTLVGTNSFSGETAPSSPTVMTTWYDTSTNIVKVFDGTDWVSNCTFLLGIFDNEDAKVTGLKRVFNGFGYIGLTAYSLPGLKMNFVSGRNKDGTFTTKEVLTTTVTTRTYDVSKSVYKRQFCIDDAGGWVSAENIYQDADGRLLSEYDDRQIIPLMNYYVDGVISGVKFYNTVGFANIDGTNLSVGGRSRYSALGLPSNKYIDLTLGASETTYVAPANGYVFLCMRQQATGTLYVQLRNISTNIREQTPNLSGIGYWGMTLAVRKGDPFIVYYASGYDLGAGYFRFYYAEGEA